jgi:hypothetical protein
MMQTRQFDNLMGPKVPHLKQGVMNLLKVVDLSNEDQATLVKLGFGDLLTKAGTSNKPVDKINLDLEMSDELKASTIMIKFIAFRASEKVDIKSVPRRM